LGPKHRLQIYDKLGARSRVHRTAEEQGVRLIPVRNSNPLLDLYRHLNPLSNLDLIEPPEDLAVLKERINDLPIRIFAIE